MEWEEKIVTVETPEYRELKIYLFYNQNFGVLNLKWISELIRSGEFILYFGKIPLPLMF